ncbi:dihydrofolate synthase [Desulfocucumis palustris]|uniref:tetrahydrofolate synthase n=1 Tax=Desulfocucumis palustris TaxID=1898651 RepID=A0A2L2XEX2_9FIRM|nr:folylpolyglutamate synthase/dihydrofolate synthase family protein [Desulfocucumis palustris]GBF34897.1 dihydrofolate synthase [Desulfocucumis palustris]
MNFPEAIEYMQNLTKFGFNFGLGRITELLRRLGNPHLDLRIIHIGGTNGKGSTTAMVSSILRQAGFRAGAFTSPHLHSYTERYKINGEEIAEKDMAALITELRPHLEAMVREGYEHPTEFEVGTALAFVYFKRMNVDYLVLEVGLGGAIDSTNVAVPLVSVITNVAMDHMDYLGNTVKEIAAVKAGIIKRGVPLVTAAGGEALEVIQAVSRENNSPLVLVGRDVTWRELEIGPKGQIIEVSGRLGKYSDIIVPLMGRHQQINAATAVAVIEALRETGAAVDRDAVAKGIAGTRWPARMEVVARNPFVLIDGAHNLDGAIALGRALDDYFPGRGIIMVLGMLGDKERTRVVEELAPRARAVVITRPNSPRAGNWQSMAGEAARFVDRVLTIEDITGAVDAAMDLAGPDDVVCVTGSLYMVAEARERFVK